MTGRFDDLLFTGFEGPRMVIRSCRWCKHMELVPKGLRGVGRGYGMREGNKARGRMIQHVKVEHPREYEYAMTLYRRHRAEAKVARAAWREEMDEKLRQQARERKP